MTSDTTKSPFGARFQGMLYAFLHATVRRTILGATIRGWLVNASLFLALLLWAMDRPAWAVTIVILDLILRLLYWKARRDGYVRFIADGTERPDDGTPPVVDNKKVAIEATGIFSAKDWEEYILAQMADYWRVPMGDHAIMVQYVPGRFLYQFIRLGTIVTLEAGSLCRGSRPQKALAITYLTSWGPESEDPDFMFYAPSDENNPARKQRRMFLAFEDEKTRDSVWRGFLTDSQQK